MRTRTSELLDKLGLQSEYREKCERMVLSICLLAPEYVPAAMSVVSVSDIVEPSLKKLFRLIGLMSINDEPITSQSVLLSCHKSGLLDEIGGKSEYAKLVSYSPAPDHYEHYCREVVRLAACEKVFRAAERAMDASTETDCDPSAEVKNFENATRGLEASKPASKVGGVILAIHASRDPEAGVLGTCIKTGFPSFDELIGGLYNKTLVLLGGRFGKGKSCLAAQFVSSCVASEKSAMIFSLEMSEQEFVQRILSGESGISMNAWLRLRSDEEQARIKGFHVTQQAYNWEIDDDSHQSIDSIRAKCQLMKSRGGLDLVVIDNLQILDLPVRKGRTVEQETKSITVALKKMAKDLDVCIVLLCQLDTEAGRNRPGSTSWASCKSIEGDADVAMILHQPKPDSPDYDLILTKVRSQGPTGTLSLRFYGEFQRFEDSSFDRMVAR